MAVAPPTPGAAPSAGRPRALGPALRVAGYGAAAAGLAVLAAALWSGVALPYAKVPVPWPSRFGFPAAVALGLLAAVWLTGYDAWRAGRPGAAWGYAGLGAAVAVVAAGLFWVVGAVPVTTPGLTPRDGGSGVRPGFVARGPGRRVLRRRVSFRTSGTPGERGPTGGATQPDVRSRSAG